MICPHCNKPVITKIDKEKRAKVLALLDQGYSTRDIYTMTGVSPSSVSRIRKKGKAQ